MADVVGAGRTKYVHKKLQRSNDSRRSLATRPLASTRGAAGSIGTIVRRRLEDRSRTAGGRRAWRLQHAPSYFRIDEGGLQIGADGPGAFNVALAFDDDFSNNTVPIFSAERRVMPLSNSQAQIATYVRQ